MAPAMVDDVSLLLLVAILSVLIAARMQRHWKQPALHPLILTHQADASQVRSANSSPVYRHVNAPIGLDLAMRPQRSAPDIPGLLLDGLSPPDVAAVRRVLDASVSNADLIEQATRLAHGLAALIPGESRTLVVHGGITSARAVIALLAGAGFKGFPKVVTVVMPAESRVEQLPVDGPAAVLCLAGVPPCANALLIARDAEHAVALGATAKQWDDVLGAAIPAEVPRAEPVRATPLELDEIGQREFAWFYDMKRSSWLVSTHTAMTSGVTAILSEYPAELIPGVKDRIAVASLDVASPLFCGLLLTTLYTGAGLVTGDDACSLISSYHPSIVYADADGASDLAEAFADAVPKSYAESIYQRHLYSLRHGIIPRDDFVDKLVGSEARRTLGAENIRNMTIVGSGCAANQALLDALRVYLVTPVIHAYVPQVPSADVVPVAFTAPVSASNVYDFQAFASAELGDRELPVHVGPPSVSLELKIVNDTEAVHSHIDVISNLRADTTTGVQDSVIGEIFVRGYSVASASMDTVTPSSPDFVGSEWVATGDIGFVRTNGTLVVVQENGMDVPGVARVRQRMARKSRSMPIMTLIGMLCFLAISGAQASMHGRRDVDSVIDSELLDNAINSLLASQRSSWEQGVAQSALLESLYPKWSVFTSKDEPLYPAHDDIDMKTIPARMLTLAYHSISAQDSAGRLCTLLTGDEKVNTGASLDSASCGEGALIGSLIYEGFQNNKPIDDAYWGKGVTKQFNYLQTNVSRSKSGAISQRAAPGVIQAWSDGAYMLPPFLAQYGLMTNNRSLVNEAYDQLRLYRNLLMFRDGPGKDLWGHIRSIEKRAPKWIDRRAWLTGNGWATAGMLKVAATIRQSQFAAELHTQHDNLINWAEASIIAADKFFDPNLSLYHNVVNDTKTFADASGSALMAYSAFRLAGLDKNKDHTQNAEKIYQKLRNSFDPMGAFVKVHTVNELNTNTPAPTSSESLSFLIMLQSARRDFLSGNGTSDNSGKTDNGSGALALPGISISAVSAVLVTLLSLFVIHL